MHKYAKNPILHMCLKTGTNHPKKGIISRKIPTFLIYINYIKRHQKHGFFHSKKLGTLGTTCIHTQTNPLHTNRIDRKAVCPIRVYSVTIMIHTQRKETTLCNFVRHYNYHHYNCLKIPTMNYCRNQTPTSFA